MAPAETGAVRIDDRAMMVGGSLGFGLVIPLLTDLQGALGPADPRFWLGQALFIGLAFAIWGGNRWLLLKQRQHVDWFSHPLRKLLMLVSANVLYTAPVTLAGLALWSWLAPQPLPRSTVGLVVLTNVICVLFVTHAYETLFLIREREGDLMRVERLQRARAQAELGALKAQVDPHFLFNSLNTLGHLIHRDAARAREFCDALAEVYRYVLAARERDLVPLDEELAFVRRYQDLLSLRFGASVRLVLTPALLARAAGSGGLLPPLALQTLLENAVKHNQAGSDAALVLTLDLLPDDRVQARNAVRPRSSALPGSGRGLLNLDERCQLLTGRALRQRRSGDEFIVEVPLAATATAPEPMTNAGARTGEGHA
jgi:Histidine kinase